jgi:23S rRNA (uracil1939-C5)-methyltransferase
MLDNEIIVFIEKIGHNGISIGKYKNKIVFVYGALPGEKVKLRVLKNRKKYYEGEIVEILEKSPFRIDPLEDHYLSCSPWQVFDYNYQIELKKNLLYEIYKTFAKEEIELVDFFHSPLIFEYRTKIEFSFLKNDDLYLAFHKRGNPFSKIILKNGCALIDKISNQLSLKFLNKINKLNFKNPKYLIVRRSINYNDYHLSFLITKKDFLEFEDENLIGFTLALSNPKTPAASYDEILFSSGREFLKEKILEFEFRYPYDSFFQNNVFLFNKVLEIMKENVDDVNKVVDLYSGVGVIGICLRDKAKKIICVESNKKAAKYSKINAKINGVNNFKAINLQTEKIPEIFLEKTDLLILDPPRSGLSKKVLNLILKTKPHIIFYLSCNPISQARDYSFLKENYKINKIFGFDFYPNTPHLESLMFLSEK